MLRKISFFPVKLFVQVLRGCPYITVSIETSFPMSTYLHNTYKHKKVLQPDIIENEIENGIN